MTLKEKVTEASLNKILNRKDSIRTYEVAKQAHEQGFQDFLDIWQATVQEKGRYLTEEEMLALGEEEL